MASNLEWQEYAVCAQPQHLHKAEWFFSKLPIERYGARNLCYTCPVRRECLVWALNTRQIWGTWGGKDESELRRALAVNHDGVETRRNRYPQCPFCGARPSALRTFVVSVERGRWREQAGVECVKCGFAWHSRTSARSVEAYQRERERKARDKKRS